MQQLSRTADINGHQNDLPVRFPVLSREALNRGTAKILDYAISGDSVTYKLDTNQRNFQIRICNCRKNDKQGCQNYTRVEKFDKMSEDCILNLYSFLPGGKGLITLTFHTISVTLRTSCEYTNQRLSLSAVLVIPGLYFGIDCHLNCVSHLPLQGLERE